MRVKGSKMPSNAFSVEQQPNHAGYVLVRFYENAEAYSEETEVGIEEGWIYDEYTLELLGTATLEEDILNQYDVYMQQAKLRELSAQPFNPLDYRRQVAQAAQSRADIDYIAIMAGVDLM